jgi:hypothetical protein
VAQEVRSNSWNVNDWIQSNALASITLNGLFAYVYHETQHAFNDPNCKELQAYQKEVLQTVKMMNLSRHVLRMGKANVVEALFQMKERFIALQESILVLTSAQVSHQSGNRVADVFLQTQRLTGGLQFGGSSSAALANATRAIRFGTSNHSKPDGQGSPGKRCRDCGEPVARGEFSQHNKVCEKRKKKKK